MTVIHRLSPGLLIQELQGDLGGVFFGIVDKLAIVPVAGGNTLTLHSDGAGPGGSSTCISDASVVSIPLSSSEVKVGVWVGLGVGLLQLHTFPACRDTQLWIGKIGEHVCWRVIGVTV